MAIDQVFGKESMDGLTAFVEVVKALAWPGLIAGALWRFHRHIAYLVLTFARSIKRMNRVSWGDLQMQAVAAEAGEAIEVVKDQIKSEPAIPDAKKEEIVVSLDNSAKRLHASAFGFQIGDLMNHAPFVSIAEASSLSHLADVIGISLIFRSAVSGEITPVDAEWRKFKETTKFQLMTGGLLRTIDLDALQRRGYLDSDLELTEAGHRALRRIVRDRLK